MIENYQRQVLGPNDIVDYATEMVQKYRPEQLQVEPMIGFRVLLKDLNAHVAPPAQRLKMIDAELRILVDTGCIIRESLPSEAKDGLWLVTFPVPTSLLMRQIENVTRILVYLQNRLGIISVEVIDINVSGRCPVGETELRMGNLVIPQEYHGILTEPLNTPYKVGHLIRINESFALLRTRWDWSSRRIAGKVNLHRQEMLIIPQLLTAVFR